MAKLFPFSNITNLLVSFITFSNIIYNKQEHYDRLTARTQWNTFYDYVIVGAGTAGSVLASRLTEDESLTVLLLEAGGSETVSSNTPGMQDTLPGSLMDWKITSVPQNWSCQAMNEQRCLLPAGRVIGGTSSINRMYYLRGNPNDYDTWEHKFGLKSWGWKDTFPYIVRNENQTDPDRAKSGYFGVGGPMPLEKSSEYNHLLESFIFTSKLSGYQIADLNTGVSIGTSILQTTTLKGKRVSAASAFLEPHLQRRNLHILSNSYVYQIVFDPIRPQHAIGVRFYRNWKSYAVFAKREVIISAGAINTPKLLMLSGIGPREELHRHSIPVVAELPVGENLHDHVATMGMHFTVDLPNDLTAGSTVNKQTLKQYFQTGKGPLAEARVAATMFKSAASSGADNAATRQEYAGYHESTTAVADLMLLIYEHSLGSKELNAEQAEQRSNLRKEVWNRYYRPHKGRTQFTILPVVLKPKSRGSVRLSSPSPLDPPLVNPNYLSHPDDGDRLLEAMYEAIRHVHSRPFRAFNTEMFRTIIPGCEAEAPFQVQDMTMLVSPLSAESPQEIPIIESSSVQQQQTLWPASNSYPASLVTVPAPSQNISTANKLVTSFLTKFLFDSSKKENSGSGGGGGVGSFFGLRTRKQRSRNIDYATDYERYWLQDSGATASNTRYQSNMIDGFSSVAVSTAADYTDMNEEIEEVWSNHRLRTQNTTYSQRPVHHQSYSHNLVTINTRRTTTKTTTTTSTTTSTARPRTTRRSTTRRMTTRQMTTTARPYFDSYPDLETSTAGLRPLPVVIIDRNPLMEPPRYVPTQATTSPPLETQLPVRSPPVTAPKLPATAPPLTDQYLRCVSRQLTAPMGDYVGTCRMGAEGDINRVVDSKFRVVGGIEGLRVVDASVVPEIVSGGIAPVAMMLGERAADFIKQDLRRSRRRKK